MQAVADFQEALSGIADEVGDSVVGIGRHGPLGSGVIIKEGQILTNAHNLRGDTATVTFSDGRRETAEALGVNVDADLAVLSADTGDLAPVGWTPEVDASIGTPVVGLSNPGGRGLRVTLGFVSGTGRTFRGPRGRRISGTLEHTAPLLPGSSGGPIVGTDGSLLGINTNRLGEGFYLAIPADESLQTQVEELASGELTSRPVLGIGVAAPRVARGLRRAVGLADAEGVLVRRVAEESPADSAGIREGDLITSVGERQITDVDGLYDALDDAQPGASLSINLLRGNDEVSVTAVLEEGE